MSPITVGDAKTKKLSGLLWHFPEVALGYKNMIEIKKGPWQAFEPCHSNGSILYEKTVTHLGIGDKKL